MTAPKENEILDLALAKGILSASDLEKVDQELSDARTMVDYKKSEGSRLYLLLKKGLLTPEIISTLVQELTRAVLEPLHVDLPSSDVPMEISTRVRKSGSIYKRRYKLLNLLGEGGMGRVYKAVDLELNRYVAVKLLREDDPDFVTRLSTEAKTQARLDHPNICRVYDVGKQDGKPFIAMEYIDGITLQSVRDTLTIEDKVRIMRDVAGAMASAHEQGLIHRDLNPRNIMVERQERGGWRAVIMDFGLAREVAAPGVTVTGAILGTPHYMSPEQALGDSQDLDARTDVFSLGATLFFLLTGFPPFDGTAIEVLRKVVEEDPPLLRKVNPTLPRDLESIVLKCMEKLPANRYKSARVMEEDLRRFLDGEPVEARPSTWSLRLIKKARKHRTMTALLALLVVIVTGFSTLFLYSSWRDGVQESLRHEYEGSVGYIEQLLRHAYTAPLHDVRPEEARASAYVESLIKRVDRRGRLARGPGNYAIGRALLALRQFEDARAYLEKAWNSGYRKPEVAYALGSVMGELYQKELLAVRKEPDEERREVRRRKLIEEYRMPALALLRESRGIQVDAPEYVEALIAYYEGQYMKALSLTRQVFIQFPWMYEARTLEGNILMALGEERLRRGDDVRAQQYYEEAGEALRIAMAMAESDTDVLKAEVDRIFGLVEVIERREDIPLTMIDQALEASDRSIRANPENVEAYLSRSEIYELLSICLKREDKDPTEAINRALESAEEAIAVNIKDARAYARKGSVYWNLALFEMWQGKDLEKSFHAALENFRKALALDPDSADAHNNVGVVYKAIAQNAMERGEDPVPDLKRAIASYRQALRNENDLSYTKIYNNLGRAYELMGLYLMDQGRLPSESLDQAVEFYQKALDMDATNAYLHNNLGNVHWASGKYAFAHGKDPLPALEKAEIHYRKTIEINPDYVFAYSNLGNTLVRKAEWVVSRGGDPQSLLKEARDLLHAAIDNRPNYHNAMKNLSETYLVEARFRARRDEDPLVLLREARTHLDRARELNPSSAEFLALDANIWLAEALWFQTHGRSPADALNRARNSLISADNLNPRDAEIQALEAKRGWMMAVWLLQHGADAQTALQEAESHARKSINLNEDLAEGHQALGIILCLKARGTGSGSKELLDESHTEWERAVKLNPMLKEPGMSEDLCSPVRQESVAVDSNPS